MFGVDEEAPTPLRQHRLVWPLFIAALGATISLLAVIVLSGGVIWLAPLIVGPNLTLMGIVGVFLPGVTGVIGFDWRPYTPWQVYLGAAWFALAILLPTMAIAGLAMLSLLL
jgi:hypothetical protein